jgi:4-hydroxy-tetrahydrodipicolinate reductase
MEGIVHFGIVGACGKMGWEIIRLAEKDDEVSPHILVDPRLDHEDDNCKHRINDIDLPGVVDVIIDFSTPDNALISADWCVSHGKPIIIGTTGLDESHINSLKNYSGVIPILVSSNMSLGVNLIDALLPQIATILQGFAVEIQEIHHDQKKDSPSGTALRFAETLVKAKGGEIVYGRVKGKSDNRPISDVVVHSLRGGTVPGEHTIYFLGTDEVIKITHSALSRKIFAMGAIRAAKWIVDQPPGFYSMNDVLGL